MQISPREILASTIHGMRETFPIFKFAGIESKIFDFHVTFWRRISLNQRHACVEIENF